MGANSLNKQKPMKVPEDLTWEKLESELSKHKQLNSDHFFRCRCCGKRNFHDSMRGVQYPEDDKPLTLEDMYYFCLTCLDLDTYDFIINNSIDIRSLNTKQINNIQAAYYDGSYENWIREQGGESED